MKNKFKSIALAVVLGVFGIFAGVGLSGCGASLTTVKNDYIAMTKKITSLATEDGKGVFYPSSQSPTVEGIVTTLKVRYGEFVEKYIGNRDTRFTELETKYNSILVISNDYVALNIEVVTRYDQKKLSKSAKKSVERLSKSIKDFTKYLGNFATARNNLEDYFLHHAQPSEANIESQLVVFKKSYGTLVEKSLNISNNLADVMENTSIYDTLKASTTDTNSLKIIRDYTRAKMLPIFSRFMLSEISNQFIWDNYKAKTETTRKIDALLSKLKSIYNVDFKNLVNSNPRNTNAKIGDLFNMVDAFMKESESYFNALSDFNIRDFVVSNEGNIEEYIKTKKLAKRDLYKIEQFINITLPDFISAFVAAIS